jgi:two-component system sensor histidine kinase HydH
MRYSQIGFAEKIKLVLIAVIFLNIILAFIHIKSYTRNIDAYKHHIVDMGINALKSLEGGRRAFMISRLNDSERFKNFVEELSRQNSVLNMVIFDDEGNILVNPFPAYSPLYMGKIEGFRTLEKNDTITIYTSLQAFNSMNGRMSMNEANAQRHRMRGMMHSDPDEFHNFTVALVMDSSTVSLAKKQMYIGLIQIGLILIFLVTAYVLVLRFVNMHLIQIEKLKKAEQEAEMGKMSYILAHEIKNPLSAVSGLISYATKKEQNSDIKEILEHSTNEINRLNNIVNDFLSFGKELKADLTDVSLKELIEKTLNLLSADFAERSITPVVEGTDAVIKADSDKMLQVLFNLIINALHASPHNGKVYIDYSSKGIRIENHILGEAPDQQKLFHPFYTTKVKGSGHGLAVVKRICDLHDFQVSVININPFIIEITFGR